jgi:cytochrome P450
MPGEEHDMANASVAGSEGPALVDLADPELWQDLHAPLRAARGRHPVALGPGGERLVLRHADVEALSSDPRLVSNALPMLTRHGVTNGPLFDWWRRMMTNQNGPGHLRLRSLVSRAFTPRRIESKRPRVRELARELVGERLESGEIDLVQHLADPLPIRLMCEILGVESEAHPDFARWSTELGRALTQVLTPEAQQAGEEAATGLGGAISELIAARRARPRDDLLSALLAASAQGPERFADEDLVTLVINLLFGGHDTSRSMLSIGMALLLQHPEQLARLRREPALAASAGEEILRFEPPIAVLAREPVLDIEMGGIVLRKGEMVFLSILSANRDERVFRDPDRFDIARDGPRSLSFGWGPHHCLGAALARVEIQEALPALLRDFDFELLEAPRWVPFVAIRRLDSVRGKVRPARG